MNIRSNFAPRNKAPNMKKNINYDKSLSVEDIHDITPVDYADGDIAFIDDIRNIPQHVDLDKTIKLDMILFLLCVKGKMQLRIKNETFTAVAADVVCCGSETMVDDCMISTDFEAKILCIAPRVMQRLIHTDKHIWNTYFYMRQHPIAHIDDDGRSICESYYDLLKKRIAFSKHKYTKEAMSCLVGSVLYDFLGMISSQNEVLSDDDGEPVKQSDVLLRKFLELLSTTNPKERSVNYYAEQLCVTPKYLSSLLKNLSGKTAYDWITECVVEDIKHELLYTDHSIKEISNILHFPNMSFFGKYVKQHLGVSPTDFRKEGEKKGKEES